MQYFIAVVPPKGLSEDILAFQSGWKENQFFQWVEPHITVKAQAGLDESMNWLEKVKAVARQSSPFVVRLGPPQTFGSSVVFLSLESPELRVLHTRLVDAVNPSERLRQTYFERPGEFTPHLTLGTTASGLTEQAIEEIRRRAACFASVEPFGIGFMRLYRQDHEGDRYLPVEDISLGN